MVDIASIQAAVGSLKMAADITKTALGLRDVALVQSKVMELNGVIISAQSSALDAKAEQLELLDRIRTLEADLRRFEQWEAEKQRYRLAKYTSGNLAYVLKRSEANGEPGHALCPSCYHRGIKSILQDNRNPYRDKHAFVCPSCKNELLVGSTMPPEYVD